MADEPEGTLDPEVEVQDTPDPPEQPEPRMYAGKFKTADDMEKAYIEAQSAMTKAQQEAAELRKRDEQWAAYYAQQNAGGATDEPEDDYVEPTKANIDNIVNQRVTAALTLNSQAQGNIRAQVGKFKSDRLFRHIGDEFEAALLRCNPSEMANPQAAEHYAGLIYNNLAGQYARTAASTTDDPARRREAIENLGLAEPAGPAPLTDAVDPDGRNMLNALGLSKDDQKSVLESYSKRKERGEA